MILRTKSLRANVDGLVTRGIREPMIDDNGHLILLMTDNKEIDLGNVVGKPGVWLGDSEPPEGYSVWVKPNADDTHVLLLYGDDGWESVTALRGIGIADVVLEEDGRFTFTFEDGREKTVGEDVLAVLRGLKEAAEDSSDSAAKSAGAAFSSAGMAAGSAGEAAASRLAAENAAAEADASRRDAWSANNAALTNANLARQRAEAAGASETAAAGSASEAANSAAEAAASAASVDVAAIIAAAKLAAKEEAQPVGTVVTCYNVPGGPDLSTPEKYAEAVGFGVWEKRGEGRTLMGANAAHAAGTTAAAGLPNITGEIGVGNVGYYWNIPVTQATGAFESSVYKNYYTKGGDNLYSETPKAMRAKFDASRSSPIYGASDTVQPPALFVYVYQRIA